MVEKEFKIDEMKFIINEISESELIQINEANHRGRNLIGNYSYDIHQPHNPTGEYHLNLYKKGKQIVSINKVSGTAHDNFHGTRIPNKAFKSLSNKFPDWKWPKDQIVESADYTYFLENITQSHYRLVKVSDYSDFNLKTYKEFTGYFHQFADDPFLTGGDGGWKQRTVALIEDDRGQIRKVPVESFRFLDT